MLLFEIGNTRLPLEWRLFDDSLSTSFELDGVEYGISANRDKFDGISAVEVYFYTVVDGLQSLDPTALGKNEFKVLSIVTNAIAEKLGSESVVWFSAKNDAHVDKRKNIYSKIANRISRKRGYFLAKGKQGADYLFILYKNKNDGPRILSYLGVK